MNKNNLLHIHPAETALIVVDVQVDFCSPQGSTARRGRPNTLMQALPAKINAFVEKIRPLGVSIIFTRAIVDSETMPENLRLFNQVKGVTRPTLKDSGGEALYGVHIPDDGMIVDKTYADAFALTNLRAILDERGIKNLLICGVRTEICVDATVRRANAEGYHTFVVADLVATRDNTLDDQHHALKFLDAYYAYVMDSNSILELFTGNLTTR
jgi:nicotinamidase-related amidase